MLSIPEIKLDNWDQIKQALLERRDQPQEAIKLVYRVWLEVPDSVLPEDLTYSRSHTGLCVFLVKVMLLAGLRSRSITAMQVFHSALLKEGLGKPLLPFGAVNYERGHLEGTQHQDPARIAWVERVLNGEVSL